MKNKKTMYDKMEYLLKNEPRARERSNKNRSIAYFLKIHHPILESLPPKQLEEIIKLSNSYDRAWRKVTGDNPKLRGTDYGNKKELEQEKQVELGYGGNLYQDVIKQ